MAFGKFQPVEDAALLAPQAYFRLDGWEHAALFDGLTRVWEALGRLEGYLRSLLNGVRIEGTVMEGAWVEGDVFVGPGAVIESGAMVKGPTWIGPGAVIRHGAYVRGVCLIGARSVVGHASEVKGSVFLDGAQAPHFNYVGDSLLGRGVNLGAGTKLSNLKNDGSPVVVKSPDGREWPTGRRKLGVVAGDGVQTGCNCVTSPGTLIGPGTLVYPNVVLRGIIPAGSIVKLRQQLEVVPQHPRKGAMA